jgi:hypothetical protein
LDDDDEAVVDLDAEIANEKQEEEEEEEEEAAAAAAAEEEGEEEKSFNDDDNIVGDDDAEDNVPSKKVDEDDDVDDKKTVEQTEVASRSSTRLAVVQLSRQNNVARLKHDLAQREQRERVLKEKKRRTLSPLEQAIEDDSYDRVMQLIRDETNVHGGSDNNNHWFAQANKLGKANAMRALLQDCDERCGADCMDLAFAARPNALLRSAIREHERLREFVNEEK